MLQINRILAEKVLWRLDPDSFIVSLLYRLAKSGSFFFRIFRFFISSPWVVNSRVPGNIVKSQRVSGPQLPSLACESSLAVEGGPERIKIVVSQVEESRIGGNKIGSVKSPIPGATTAPGTSTTPGASAAPEASTVPGASTAPGIPETATVTFINTLVATSDAAHSQPKYNQGHNAQQMQPTAHFANSLINPTVDSLGQSGHVIVSPGQLQVNDPTDPKSLASKPRSGYNYDEALRKFNAKLDRRRRTVNKPASESFGSGTFRNFDTASQMARVDFLERQLQMLGECLQDVPRSTRRTVTLDQIASPRVERPQENSGFASAVSTTSASPPRNAETEHLVTTLDLLGHLVAKKTGETELDLDTQSSSRRYAEDFLAAQRQKDTQL